MPLALRATRRHTVESLLKSRASRPSPTKGKDRESPNPQRSMRGDSPSAQCAWVARRGSRQLLRHKGSKVTVCFFLPHLQVDPGAARRAFPTWCRNSAIPATVRAEMNARQEKSSRPAHNSQTPFPKLKRGASVTNTGANHGFELRPNAGGTAKPPVVYLLTDAVADR